MYSTDTKLSSLVIETRPIIWRQLKFIQQDDFKVFDDELTKLKNSIQTNGFIQPFYVWEHDGDMYCLDGKHRTIALQSLADEGASIPEYLPGTFLNLTSKEQAAKLVLLFSSTYAKVTKDGLYEFITLYDLDFDDLKLAIDIPELDIPSFEKLFLNEDYSMHNAEVLADDISDEMTLKLKFDKDSFIAVNNALNNLKHTKGLNSKEDALMVLLGLPINNNNAQVPA